MNHGRGTLPNGSPTGNLYDPAVAKVQRMSVEKARPKLGQLVEAARHDNMHTVVAKHTEDTAVIVPMDWYRSARKALGDPTDL